MSCLFVCPSARLSKKHTTKSHKLFCTRYLWPWLSPPLRYLMYFRFWGWRHVLHERVGRIRDDAQTSSSSPDGSIIGTSDDVTTLSLTEMVRWWHRGEVCHLRLQLMSMSALPLPAAHRKYMVQRWPSCFPVQPLFRPDNFCRDHWRGD